MSRLDRHVDTVQNKLALGEFLIALARALAIFAGVVLLVVLIDKFFHVKLPRQMIWFWSGLGAAVAFAIGFAMYKRPTRHQAAIKIDETLGLKERFSTALYARPTNNDPFAKAAVLDAEKMADNVSIHKRFPLPFPRWFLGAIGFGLAAFVCTFLPQFELFAKTVDPTKKTDPAVAIEQSKVTVREAIAKVEAIAKTLPNDESVKNAKLNLEQLLNTPGKDPEATKRSAFKAMQEMNESIKQKIKDNQKFADAQNDQKMFRGMNAPIDEKGPVADAHRAIQKGDFSKAVDDLQKVVDNFDKMDKKEQEKAAQQMKQMAQQLQQMAQNPQMQQQMQQQLQQMGANPQQAQQMAQAMQQAAQGNPQAQQQLQQMAQQMQQQMAGNPQMQAKMQQMMQQMQAQANGQQQAQQMAQAAQQMAQAMQQGAQQNGQQNPNQQNGQQNGQQKGGQQGQQQMGQAVQQMQQQLQQMQAQQQDAQQIAAAQDAAQQAADDAAGQCNGNGNGQGQGQGKGGQNGEWKEGDPAGKQGGGMGGPGIGQGGRGEKQQSPFAIKPEMSPSQDIKEGKVLASTFVKASTIKGESKVGLSNVAASAEKEATDEVETERINRSGQKAVRDYFKSMEDDAKPDAKP